MPLIFLDIGCGEAAEDVLRDDGCLGLFLRLPEGKRYACVLQEGQMSIAGPYEPACSTSQFWVIVQSVLLAATHVQGTRRTIPFLSCQTVHYL